MTADDLLRECVEVLCGCPCDRCDVCRLRKDIARFLAGKEDAR